MKQKNFVITVRFILNGCIVNDSMGAYITNVAIKNIIEDGQAPKNSKFVIWGLTFMENCPDCRNSKVADIIARLVEYCIELEVVDMWVDPEIVKQEYVVELMKLEDAWYADCVIVAVVQNEFKELGLSEVMKLFREKIRRY